MIRIGFVVFAFVQCISVCCAHSGRTDARGGHHDRIRGGYHYHNSGYTLSRNLSRPSSRLSPRSSYRSQSRSHTTRQSRSEIRTRAPRTKKIFVNCEYLEISKKKVRTEGNQFPFALMETTTEFRKENKKYARSFFILSDDHHNSAKLSGNPPTLSQLEALYLQIGDFERPSRFYLNGMSKHKHAWAKGKSISDGKYAIWVRQVPQEEFKRESVHLASDFRWWQSRGGNYKLFAAFVNLDSRGIVELLKKSGENVFVDRKKLSREDNAYIDKRKIQNRGKR